MQIIKGKYNSANVMIDEIDDNTRKQIQDFVNNPSFAGSYISIMPDCHAGKGSCIGFTMQMNERIIPEVVGVDIGCGMLTAEFPVESVDVQALDRFIKQNIPSGFNKNKSITDFNADPLKTGLITFLHRSHVFERLGLDGADVGLSLGTLGGGNHFIEAGISNLRGTVWVTIHSGSRNFGLQIAKYHTKVAKEICDKYGSDTQGMPFLLKDSAEGRQYRIDQRIGVQYAQVNRKCMMEKLVGFFGYQPKRIYESIHNFIDESGMIRKGATPAHDGQVVLIPFNMRDGMAIGIGKGSKKYNYSAPHGAGRILSRSKAKELLDVEYFKEDMKQAGVYTTTANAGTLDESPDAYKDMDLILENIKETVAVVDMIKPVYNFKA